MKKRLIAMLCCAASSITHATEMFVSPTLVGKATELAGQSAPKSASTSTLGARATVTTTAVAYGGFELSSPATVYILVRGNSLGTLGITQDYLDLPRVRVFSAGGQDLYMQGGFPGFGGCASTDPKAAPVISYYQSLGIPVSERDACLADTFQAGVYTFTVRPSQESVNSPDGDVSHQVGEMLFEVKLGP